MCFNTDAMVYQSDKAFSYREHWLSQRSDSPYWYIAWHDTPFGHVRRRSTRTLHLEAAKEALVGFAGQPAGTKVEEPAWFEFTIACDLYASHAHERPSHAATVAAHKRLLSFAARRHIAYASQFNLVEQDHYIAWRRAGWRAQDRVGSNATINRELEALRATLRYAWKCGRLSRPPYVELLPSPPPRKRVLSVEECRRLMAVCTEPHVALFIKMALFTLQRRSALLELKVEQADLVGGVIYFNPPGRPQTNKRRPVIPIASRLFADLATAIQASRSGFIIEYKGKTVRSVKRGLATSARRAGLSGVGPNVLRRSAATLLAGEGVPMRQITGMLGQFQLRITERYAQHQPEYLRETVHCLTNAIK